MSGCLLHEVEPTHNPDGIKQTFFDETLLHAVLIALIAS